MIIVEHLTKRFGERAVLQDISLRFGRGKIYGIVGRNGCGKTVLFKCICGFLQPTDGTVTVDGKIIGRDVDMIPDAGVILEAPGFLPGYSGMQNLWFLAGLRGKIRREDCAKAMEQVGLDPADRKWVGRYSLGMRQRLGLAQAIMEDPKVLILDEPMNGLDDQGVREVRNLLLRLREQEKIIMLASHNREDIEEMCDVVVRMDGGSVAGIRCF